MVRHLRVFLVIALCTGLAGAAGRQVEPYEAPADGAALTRIDELVREKLRAEGLEPAERCSDAVFVRRVYVDVAGTIPTAAEAEQFLADDDPGKRAKLIDELLESEQFADYCSLKWCDALRVKAEYPIKLWPNAVQAYHRWIRESIAQNRPYDEFVRALLCSSGSNFRVPPVIRPGKEADSRPAPPPRALGPLPAVPFQITAR